jgi:hypothetical protein
MIHEDGEYQLVAIIRRSAALIRQLVWASIVTFAFSIPEIGLSSELSRLTRSAELTLWDEKAISDQLGRI